jgi:serine protease Do
MHSALRTPHSAFACLLLTLLGTGSLAAAAEPEAPVTLPDVRAIVRQRQNAVVRVETFESYIPGLLRRTERLANPFPLTSNIGDAFSFAFYLPSGIFYGLRKHLGSGVLFDAEGYLLTNHHVVKGADSLAVRLTDAKGVGHLLDARVVGTDRHADVALVKIDPKQIPLVTVPLADSDQVALGDWVIAVGNPYYLTGTVTCGVVSGLHRQVGQNLLEDFLQVDAAVNPGNSGGPILNTKGEVIGLVDLGMFPANNIGFAIPTSLITPFLDDLKKHGAPRRGYLGIGVRDLTPEMAKEWGLKAETGILVADVSAFSPAARAGLKEGDIVETIGGKKMATARDVQMAALRTPPGAELVITVRRGDKTLDLKPTLAARRAPFRIF